MASQLSGIAIILFIAFGVLTFLLLFIFAKRQITRFALKSRRGPHVPVGVDAPKRLRLEIERRIDCIEKIQCEPWLLNETMKELFEEDDISQLTVPHIYRMKVVDDVKELSNLLFQSKNGVPPKRFHENIIQYYLRLHRDGPLSGVDAQTLYKFLMIYENARHQPVEFGYADYSQFVPLLKIVKNVVLKLSGSPPAQMGSKLKAKSRDDEVEIEESATPLLNKSKSSSKSSVSMRKVAHETTV